MIAIDAMGGDNAPAQIVLGALQGAKKGVAVKLFGPQEKVCSLLSHYDPSWHQYNISVCDAQQVIDMAEEPVAAIRKKNDSSLVKATKSLENGFCNALVSAGNSGAIMVCSMLILGRLEGIERPAIVGILPTKKSRIVCLDIGANTDCKPSHLLQFAYMGSLHASTVLNIVNPRVGLLSNGHEEGKGNTLIKQAFSLLKKSTLNFMGNIEPYGIFKDQADVIVSDGFSGNILLKTIESCVRAFNVIDYKMPSGGALLLGVKGTVVVVHGNADAEQIKNAILLAHKNSLKEERLYGDCQKSISRSIA